MYKTGFTNWNRQELSELSKDSLVLFLDVPSLHLNPTALLYFVELNSTNCLLVSNCRGFQKQSMCCHAACEQGLLYLTFS